jgi:hypothetical protein
MDRIVRESIEIELHPNNMNRDVAYCRRKSWEPLICSLNKSPLHDAWYLLRGHTIGNTCREATVSARMEHFLNPLRPRTFLHCTGSWSGLHHYRSPPPLASLFNPATHLHPLLRFSFNALHFVVHVSWILLKVSLAHSFVCYCNVCTS